MSTVTEDPPKKKHAILAPSAADRWMVCQGSIAKTIDIPNKDNEYSIEGTDYHEVAAVCLETDTNAMDYVGHPMLSGALVTEENAKALQKYIDLVRTYRDSEGGGVLKVEDVVPLEWLTGEKDAEGTSDASILRQDPELVVVDLKFGRGVAVSAVNNRQLKIYALGVLQKHSMFTEYDNVRLVISQPRLDSVSEWVISVKELLEFADEVKRASKPILERLANRSLPMLPLSPDEKACRFCLAKATCEALEQHVEQTLVSGFINEETGKGELKLEAKTLKPVISVSGQRLGNLMSRVELMEDFIKAVRAEVEIELLAGREVEGYKLVQGKKGNRAWSDSDAVAELFKKYRMKKDEMYDMSLISPTTAETFFSDQPTRWKEVKEHITQAEGKPSVAKASDKRPALVLNKLEDGFTNEEDCSDLLG